MNKNFKKMVHIKKNLQKKLNLHPIQRSAEPAFVPKTFLSCLQLKAPVTKSNHVHCSLGFIPQTSGPHGFFPDFFSCFALAHS